MIANESHKLRSGFYNPERSKPMTNFIVSSVFALLLGGAFFYSLTSTFTSMTERDCAAGIQKACDSLK
tara:strand:+ start:2099 stop:2302 length:204 start_codon:yes stop_codon:yes gene_type:complete